MPPLSRDNEGNEDAEKATESMYVAGFAAVDPLIPFGSMRPTK